MSVWVVQKNNYKVIKNSILTINGGSPSGLKITPQSAYKALGAIQINNNSQVIAYKIIDTCTVMVPGVLADESKQLIYVMPTIESQEVYFNAGILCINQGLDELTFKALITPTDSIRLHIILQEVVENKRSNGKIFYNR